MLPSWGVLGQRLKLHSPVRSNNQQEPVGPLDVSSPGRGWSDELNGFQSLCPGGARGLPCLSFIHLSAWALLEGENSTPCWASSAPSLATSEKVQVGNETIRLLLR